MRQRQTLKEQIYKEIIDGIVSGEFKGEQILNRAGGTADSVQRGSP